MTSFGCYYDVDVTSCDDIRGNGKYTKLQLLLALDEIPDFKSHFNIFFRIRRRTFTIYSIFKN
jgi:hypothetical protein